MNHTPADQAVTGRQIKPRWPVSRNTLQEIEAAMVAILAKPSTVGRRRQRAARLLTTIRVAQKAEANGGSSE